MKYHQSLEERKVTEGIQAGNWENRTSTRVVPTHSLSEPGKSQHLSADKLMLSNCVAGKDA